MKLSKVTGKPIKQIIALDVGLKRTGVARASTAAKLAEPLITLPANEVLDFINQLKTGEEIEAIVIGLPRGLDGQETEQTRWVRNWVNDIKPALGVPIYFQDEALTSQIVHEAEENSNNKRDIDAAAAAVILQDFLDTSPSERVVC